MPRYDIAHIREQGQDIIIVPLERTFAEQESSSQQELIVNLQIHARTARLAGQIVPVWDAGGGRMSFIAPLPWHPYFTNLNLGIVAGMINKELSW